ncbi:MAG: hypothetical protein ACI8Z9_001679, partial [Paraglaciecola sp.]
SLVFQKAISIRDKQPSESSLLSNTEKAEQVESAH